MDTIIIAWKPRNAVKPCNKFIEINWDYKTDKQTKVSSENFPI